MFVINNDDLSIYLTRGDSASIPLPITYSFKKNDVVRFQVFKKKDCAEVVLRKDFVIEEATESITIELDGSETKLVDIINKPTDFWYEVEVNPGENSKTIIGYDAEGAKILTLFPEGNDGIITYEEFVDSAYAIAVEYGEKGTKEEWLASLKGDKGDKGDKGEQGIQGEKGDKGDIGEAFTYEDFTEEQLLALVGPKGEKGDKGDKGDKGEQGIQGEKGEKGADGTVSFDNLTPEQKASLKGDNYVLTSADKAEIASQVSTSAQVLPPVSEVDEGKYLKVYHGAWCAIAISNAEGVTY